MQALASVATPSARSDRAAAKTDYQELRARVSEALSSAPRRAPQAVMLERRMRLFLVLQVCDLLVLVYAPWRSLAVLSATLFAIYRARTVWTVIHERVHRTELPATFAKTFYDFSTVYVVRFWKAHHLRHHAHTNTPADPDTQMFFGRDLNDARRLGGGGGIARRLLRFAGTVAQYPLLFVLFLVRSLATYKGGKALLYLSTMIVYAAVLAVLLPRDAARLNTAANFSIGALYILLTFAPTHSASKANFDLVGDPMLDQLVASNNVWPRSRAWSFLCGGINLHIEHHLFPYVPFDELPVIAPIVEAFARERGLPYNAYSPLGIWRAHLALLWRS